MHIKIFLKWLSKISDPFASMPKVSNWWHFLFSWRDLTPLLHVHHETTKRNLVIHDTIKASVPKFLNFLGAELDKNWITHLEGKTLLLAENTDLNQISKKFIHLSKIRFKIIAWIMQKNYIFAQKKILNHPTVILQPFIQKIFINFFLFKVSLKN